MPHYYSESDTEEEAYEKLIQQGQKVVVEGMLVIAEAEKQLASLKPLLTKAEGFVEFWSKRITDTQDESSEELKSCQELVHSLRERIHTLENIKESLTRDCKEIRIKASHA